MKINKITDTEFEIEETTRTPITKEQVEAELQYHKNKVTELETIIGLVNAK